MFEKILVPFEKFCRVAAVLSLGAMFLINVINIGFRALFNYSFVWVFPLTLFLFIWMTFFGAFVIYREKKEITVDFLYNLLPEAGRRLTSIVCNILMVALLILLLWVAPRLIRSQVSPMQILQVPRYFQATPLFLFCIGAILDFIQGTVLIIKVKKIPASTHG